MRKRPRLALEPPRKGDRWQVTLSDGTVEEYACAVDACRAKSVADASTALRTELDDVKRSWVAELGAAAKSEASAFGYVPLPLSNIRNPCVDLLLEDALARSTTRLHV